MEDVPGLLRVWRITKPAYVKTAFDGRGASDFGGRWNPVGTPMVYTAEALSLAALELLVPLDAETVRTMPYMAIPALLPVSSVETLPLNDLPDGWNAASAPVALAEFGRRWAASGQSLALRVPSAIVPVERNVLVNPAHPRMPEMQTGEPQPWLYDARLVKRA